MMNQIVLLGRIVSTTPALEYGEEALVVTIATPRNYKNDEGIYETDMFDIVLRGKNIVDNTMNYCKKGDLIGVKGRLEMFKYVRKEDGKKMRRTLIIGEKVSFLSSNSAPSTTEDPTEDLVELGE